MNAEGQRPIRVMLVAVLLIIMISGTVDLILDAPTDWRSGHVLYEVGLIGGALVTTLVLWRQWARTERSLEQTRRTLSERQMERDTWRASAEEALRGLRAVIDGQLGRWGLTAAEREVALRLLKGQSHKEIAYATSRSERTIRQHAVAVYQKSGLRGRAELAAFFLEDLPVRETGADIELAHRTDAPRADGAEQEGTASLRVHASD